MYSEALPTTAFTLCRS